MLLNKHPLEKQQQQQPEEIKEMSDVFFGAFHLFKRHQKAG
jgi:hypothetical protein